MKVKWMIFLTVALMAIGCGKDEGHGESPSEAPAAAEGHQPGNKGPGGDGHGGDQPRPPPGDQAIMASAANLSTTLPENFKKHLT